MSYAVFQMHPDYYAETCNLCGLVAKDPNKHWRKGCRTCLFCDRVFKRMTLARGHFHKFYEYEYFLKQIFLK